MAHHNTIRPQDLLEHLDWAKRLARRLVGDDATADDVVQDSVVAALRTPPDAGRPVRPWLARVVTNAARQRGRAEARRSHREGEVALPEGTADAADTAQRAEAQRMLIDAVLALDAESRDAVLLRYFDGLSAAEIARRTGVPAGTVRSRLKRALDRLRTELDTLHDGERARWQSALLPLASAPLGRAEAAAGVFGGSLMTAAVTLILGGAAILALVALLRGASFDSRTRAEPVTFTRQVAQLDGLSENATTTAGSTPTAAGERSPAASEEARAEDDNGEPLAPRTSIAMRFVDASGAPVAGIAALSGRHRSRPSGADGRTGLDVESGVLSAPRALRLVGLGIAADAIAIDAPEPGPLDLGDILVHPGGAIEGRVVDEAGAPLAGMQVRVAGRQRVGGSVGGMTVISSTQLGAVDDITDADGHFRLDGISAGHVLVEVDGEDGLRSATSGEVEVRVGQISQGLEIVAPIVDPRTRIEGVVLGPDGRPEPYARIRFEWSRWLTNHSGGTVSNVDGSFRLVVARNAEVDLWFESTGTAASLFMEDVAAGTLDLEVRLAEPRTMRITARGASGKVLTDASAALVGDGVQGDGRAAAVDGVIALRAASVAFSVVVEAPGHAERRVGPFEPTTAPETLSVELEPIATLDGRVVAGGALAAGATIEVRRVARDRVHVGSLPSRAEPGAAAVAESDAKGRFSLTVRERGRYYVRAELDGFAPTEVGPLDFDPQQGCAPLELAMTRGGALAGTVLDGDHTRRRRTLLLSRGDGTAQTLVTDPEGRYRAERLTPGAWLVRVIDDASLASSHSSTSFESAFRTIDGDCVVREGETTWYDPLVGDLAPRASVRGRLAFEGEDPTLYTFELVPAGPGAGELVPVNLPHVAPDGSFVAHGGAPGPHHLRIAGEDLTFVVELDLGAGETAFTLEASFGAVRTGDASDTTTSKLLWRGPNGVLALGSLAPNGEARRFPAGSVQRVDERGILGHDLEGLQILEEATLAPGGSVVLGH